MRDRLLQQLKIRPSEAGNVGLMALYLLMAVSAFIIGRITRDALFLSAYSREDLVYMYMIVAVAVSGPAYLYTRVADRFRRDRIIVATLSFFIVSILGIRLLLYTGKPWVYALLYVWIEVVGAFLMIQFWTFSGDIFSSRQAKRVFPIIGGGGVLANILCGATVSALVRGIGTENLLYPLAAALMICLAIAAKMGQREQNRLQDAIVGRQTRGTGQKSGVRSSLGEVFQSNHLRIIAGMTVATFITVQFIDYQFKALTKAHYTTGAVTRMDELSAFYGYFYTATGVVAAVMQFGLTGRLLERFGVVVSLLILPVSLLSGSVAMLAGVAGVFAAAVFTKGAENSMRYSVYDATMQVLYMPVPGHLRGRAKSFIDGILKPGAMGFAGLVLWLLMSHSQLPVSALAYVSIGLLVLWIGLILTIRTEYVAQLLSSLRRRRLDFSQRQLTISDENTLAALRRALASEDASEVRNALELARRIVDADLSSALMPLLSRDETDIRIAVLDMLGAHKNVRHAAQIQKLFYDPADDVWAAAVRAYCANIGEPALRVVGQFLYSDAASVRAAAVSSLIKHGGLDGILASAEHLKFMLESEEEEHRFHGAQVLCDIGVKNFYQPVLRLMRDPSLKVQNAAIRAAGAMGSPELIPALIYKLSRRETRRHASLALIAYGDKVVDTLGKVLQHEPEDPEIRSLVPRILERIGTQHCLDVLLDAIDVEQRQVRREVARSTAQLRARLGARVDQGPVLAAIADELKNHYQLLAASADLARTSDDASVLVRDALAEQRERSLDLVFRLLAIRYPLKSIELIQLNLKSDKPSVRANAVEVLDNLIDKNTRRMLLPLLEDAEPARVLARGEELFDMRRQPPAAWIREFLDTSDTWLLTAAIHAVGQQGNASDASAIRTQLGHGSPVVREAAVGALHALLDADAFDEACDPLRDDDDPVVARYTEHLFVARDVAPLAV